MLDKLRVGTVVLILVLFTISVFTNLPEDEGTRTILGALALAVAGFLFGPSLVKRNKEE